MRSKIIAEKHAGMSQPVTGRPCWHTVADAAEALGVSQSAVRRAIRRDTDVRRVSGGVVAGMVELWLDHGDSASLPGYLPYAD